MEEDKNVEATPEDEVVEAPEVAEEATPEVEEEKEV